MPDGDRFQTRLVPSFRRTYRVAHAGGSPHEAAVCYAASLHQLLSDPHTWAAPSLSAGVEFLWEALTASVGAEPLFRDVAETEYLDFDRRLDLAFRSGRLPATPLLGRCLKAVFNEFHLIADGGSTGLLADAPPSLTRQPVCARLSERCTRELLETYLLAPCRDKVARQNQRTPEEQACWEESLWEQVRPAGARMLASLTAAPEPSRPGESPAAPKVSRARVAGQTPTFDLARLHEPLPVNPPPSAVVRGRRQ